MALGYFGGHNGLVCPAANGRQLLSRKRGPCNRTTTTTSKALLHSYMPMFTLVSRYLSLSHACSCVHVRLSRPHPFHARCLAHELTVRTGFSSHGIAWASQASPQGRLDVAHEGARRVGDCWARFRRCSRRLDNDVQAMRRSGDSSLEHRAVVALPLPSSRLERLWVARMAL